MRLQFTDILGTIKNVEIPDRQFEEALDGQIMFDGSSIEGFVRIEESDMYLRPDLATFRVFPWAGTDRRESRADDLRHLHAGRHAVRRLSRARCLKKVIALAAAKGYAMKAGPEAEFFLFQTRNGVPTTETHDAAELFRSEPGRHGRGRPPRDRARARGDGLSRRGGAPRSGARPARNRLPLRRRADDGRQHQHVPVRGEERRDPQRPARDVHAQADLRHQRLGHAHAHVAVLGQRPTSSTTPKAAVAAERDVPELHRRDPAPRERVLRHHQPAGEFVQAARARLRGADQHRVVGEEPQPARARARRRAARRRASSCGCRTRPAIPTSPWR